MEITIFNLSLAKIDFGIRGQVKNFHEPLRISN
jgi:hypothetical protein